MDGGDGPTQAPVPTIDLAAPDAEVAAQICTACREVGFFALVGHGISRGQRDAVFAASARFFALPREEKMALHTSTNSHNRGWTPMGEQTFRRDKQTQGDTKEGFYIGRDISDSHPLAGTPLHGPNIWPREELLPGWRATMEAYFQVAGNLALRLTRLLALSLGLPAHALDDKFDQPIQVLRLLHYDAVPSALDDSGCGVFACGEHTDWGVLTLLLTDENPGLQILLKSGEWVDIAPQPDALIVNLGDMLERWTNGIYRSTPHRVLNVNGDERYSVPFFLEPNFHAVIECLPPCREEKGGEVPEKFAPATCGELLVAKHAATHADYIPKHPAAPRS